MPRKTESREPHPREKSSILSYLSFIWTAKIFIRNLKESLTDDTLWRPYSKHRSSTVGKQLEKSWDVEVEKNKISGKKPNLFLAVFRAFWSEIFILSVVHITQSLADVFTRPLLLKYILNYFSPNSGMLVTEFYFSACGMVLLSVAMKIVQAHYHFGSYTLGLKVKTACIYLIYNKSLRVSQGMLRELSSGHVVNLVSNDASRFDSLFVWLNHIWSTPIIAAIICYNAYHEVGLSSLPGLFFIFLISILQVIAARFTAYYRKRIAVQTGLRLRVTEEILNGIQVIKMHAWEKPFHNLLLEARKVELKYIFAANIIKGLFIAFNLITRRAAVCFTLIVYVILGERLTPAVVYVLITYYGMISASLTSTFVKGIQDLAESRVAVKRIEDFLTLDEVTKSRAFTETDMINHQKSQISKNKLALSIREATASWKENASDYTLVDINVEVKKGYLTMLVGSVASGKSSLLSLILGEMSVVAGEVLLDGRPSYCSQEPWIFAGTVRENILMGLPFDKNRYQEVVAACSLERDLDLFRNGDEEMVGERGASLSGGQRARINLARAIYKDADIYLLDDPLSAVDTHVTKIIFEKCFQGLLRNKTIILATNNLQFIRQADLVVLLRNGSIEDQGTYDDLIDAEHEYFKSGEPLRAEPKEEYETRVRMNYKWRSVQSISSCEDTISLVSVITEPEEKMPVNRDSNCEFHGSPYLEYIKVGGSVILPLAFLIILVFTQILSTVSDYYVNVWTNSQEDKQLVVDIEEIPEDRYITVYAILIGVLCVAAFARGFLFFKNAVICSRRLHVALSKSIFYTDLSFFNNNPMGALLNRFSRDLNAVDEALPKVFLESCHVFGQTLGTVGLTIVINYLLLLPFSIIATTSYLLRDFFMKTSLNLKRLEGSCRSPVFSHLTTTLAGLSTIRTHGSISTVLEQFNFHQDLHTSAVYSFQASLQGYSLLLELLSVIYLAIVIFSFLGFDENARGADVGLTLVTTVTGINTLQQGLRAASDTTSLMTCVERILSFVNLKPEQVEGEKSISAPLWPEEGKIEFRNVFLSYNEGPPVLMDLSFKINPGEKVGIVGRTGAGKSSITQALFLFAPIEGDILIDDVNTRDISLYILRSRIAVIPQDPILFSGNVRKNLDPYSDYPDYVLLKVLDELEAPDFLKESGLDTVIMDGGLNMSIGERQLLCLARAALRNSRIIILDEATANVDPSTDALIQRVIREKFSHCTVLTIAHRLNTIVDSDRVLVMDRGRIMEFDDPNTLLQKKKGYFYALIREMGNDTALDLILQAQQNYWRKQQESLEE